MGQMSNTSCALITVLTSDHNLFIWIYFIHYTLYHCIPSDSSKYTAIMTKKSIIKSVNHNSNKVRLMFLVCDTSLTLAHHISKVSSQYLNSFKRYGPDTKCHHKIITFFQGEITQSRTKSELWFLFATHPWIMLDIFSKFHPSISIRLRDMPGQEMSS